MAVVLSWGSIAGVQSSPGRRHSAIVFWRFPEGRLVCFLVPLLFRVGPWPAGDDALPFLSGGRTGASGRFLRFGGFCFGPLLFLGQETRAGFPSPPGIVFVVPFCRFFELGCDGPPCLESRSCPLAKILPLLRWWRVLDLGVSYVHLCRGIEPLGCCRHLLFVAFIRYSAGELVCGLCK